MLFSLDKIELQSPLDEDGSILVMAELILPRPAIALRRSVLEVSLRKGKKTLSKAAFHEKALLKERVVGSFGLRVAITRPTPPNQFAELISDILSTGIKNTGDILARIAFSTPPARRIAMFPSDNVADLIQDNNPRYVAEGSLDLSSESLVAGTISIPIRLNKALRITGGPSGPRNRRPRRQSPTTAFRKGTDVGFIILRLQET